MEILSDITTIILFCEKVNEMFTYMWNVINF